jgi:hypothetical protein
METPMSAITKVRCLAEWINNFHDDACSQDDLSTPDDRAAGFYNEMRNKGHDCPIGSGNGPEDNRLWGDDNAWERDFRHPDYGGDSLNWLDNVHFAYYADHGGNWLDTVHIGFSKAMTNCIGASSDWKLGVKMLKWFVLDCCQGVLNTSETHVAAVWFPPAYGVHMIFTFVGNESSGPTGIGRDFGKNAAKGEKLGNAWLDAASVAGTPIAMAYGATEEEAINRRENETINWRDYAVASANWLAWKWRD